MRGFLLIVSLLAVTCISAQKPECKKWKNGSFYMITDDGYIIDIERKGNRQTERSGKDNSSALLRIMWKSPCTYELSLWGAPKTGERGPVILVTIYETYEDHCMIEVKSNLGPEIQRAPFYRKKK